MKQDVLNKLEGLVKDYLVTFPESSKEELKSFVVKLTKGRKLNEFEKRVNVWFISKGYTITAYNWFRFEKYPKWLLEDYRKGKTTMREVMKIYQNSINIPKRKKVEEIDIMLNKFLDNMGEWLEKDEI